VSDPKKAILFIVPGITATSKDVYIRNITSEGLNNGYKVVIYHPRGLASEYTFPVEGYVCGIEDLRNTVKHIQEKYPEYVLYGVGHSLGANTLVHYIGKHCNDNILKAAVAVANPFNMKLAGKNLPYTIYDKYLVQNLQKLVQRNFEVWSQSPKHLDIQLAKALSVVTLEDFDECLTRRVYGFKSTTDYYDTISSVNHLHNVNIPLFCMNSKDDPILNPESIAVKECLANPNIILMVTHTGGHIGWFHGFFRPKRWHPKPSVEFLNCVYKMSHAT